MTKQEKGDLLNRGDCLDRFDYTYKAILIQSDVNKTVLLDHFFSKFIFNSRFYFPNLLCNGWGAHLKSDISWVWA